MKTIMKTKRFKIFLFIFLIALSSCQEILDIEQTSQLSASSMWTEEGDAIAAMYGAHQKFRVAFNKGLAFWGEYRNGLWGPGNHKGLSQTDRDQIYQSTMSNTNTYADWEGIYGTINMVNLILRYTPDISFANDSKKSEVLANAYFIRAFCYYWIARIWGDAPLLLEGYESSSQDLYPTRTPVADIYNQIEEDINNALTLMPINVFERNLASPGAINMLKADYNLWMYKVMNGGATALANATEAVNAVLSNTSYQLEENYSSIFDTETESGQEVIYAWRYTLDEYTGGYPIDYQFNSATVSSEYHFNPVAVGVQQQWCFYTDAYVSVLTEVPYDTRLNTNYLVFYDDIMNQTFHWTNKYKGSWVNGTLILDSDMIVYRLADANMFNAEIKAATKDIPGAVASLNKIAKRAYGVDNYYPSNLSAGELKNNIVKERMKEFPAEGKLWWDFIRLGVVFDMNPYLAGRENDTNILLWPLSDNSINDNPNLGGQTEGWE